MTVYVLLAKGVEDAYKVVSVHNTELGASTKLEGLSIDNELPESDFRVEEHTLEQ